MTDQVPEEAAQLLALPLSKLSLNKTVPDDVGVGVTTAVGVGVVDGFTVGVGVADGFPVGVGVAVTFTVGVGVVGGGVPCVKPVILVQLD